MNTQPIKGINIGGWLVLEKWMTPSLFKGIGSKNERELSASDSGRRTIRRHYDTFITDEDLDWIQLQAITVVRIPIGYWIFGDVQPYVGAIDRLDWLFEATAERNIQILPCLHAAPGGQNDEEHGGHHTGKRVRSWLDDSVAQARTIQVLENLAERYGQKQNLWGIELLNEPLPGRLGLKLARFYRRAYRAIRPSLRSGVYTVYSDGYAPLLLTNALGLMGSRRHPVAMDSHFYHCFTAADKKRSFDSHLRKTERTHRLITLLRIPQPVIVGEWSAMLPARVNNSQTKQFIASQKRAYNNATATFYWSYKTEAPGRWNYRDMIERGEYEI